MKQPKWMIKESKLAARKVRDMFGSMIKAVYIATYYGVKSDALERIAWAEQTIKQNKHLIGIDTPIVIELDNGKMVMLAGYEFGLNIIPFDDSYEIIE